jgi:hypothetical protein
VEIILTGVVGPAEDSVLEVASEREPAEPGEEEGETSISEMLSNPQSISSSIGTSKGCHSCIAGPIGIWMGAFMKASLGSDDTWSSPSADHVEVRRSETSLLPSTLLTGGDEKVMAEWSDVEEGSAIALVVPFGVVRVMIPGIVHLRMGRLFMAFDDLSSCACTLRTSKFPLELPAELMLGPAAVTGVKVVSRIGKGTTLTCFWSQRTALLTLTLSPRR